jgi:hypothetical protein
VGVLVADDVYKSMTVSGVSKEQSDNFHTDIEKMDKSMCRIMRIMYDPFTRVLKVYFAMSNKLDGSEVDKFIVGIQDLIQKNLGKSSVASDSSKGAYITTAEDLSASAGKP